MRVVFDRYEAGEVIPVQEHIRNRKLVKYFNRETSAAMVASVRLLRGLEFDPLMPFYYETGVMAHESLGLDLIAAESVDEQGGFSQQGFAEKGARAVPPLTQFKALYNMPLSFVAIEHGLTGDNSVIYASARGLLLQALHAPVEGNILLGCGRLFSDGAVESGFALVQRRELEGCVPPGFSGETMDLFRLWHDTAFRDKGAAK